MGSCFFTNPTRAISLAYLIKVQLWSLITNLFVKRKNNTGERMQPLGHHCEQIRNVSTATDSVWMTGQKISDPENQTLVDQTSTFPWTSPLFTFYPGSFHWWKCQSFQHILKLTGVMHEIRQFFIHVMSSPSWAAAKWMVFIRSKTEQTAQAAPLLMFTRCFMDEPENKFLAPSQLQQLGSRVHRAHGWHICFCVWQKYQRKKSVHSQSSSN